MKKLLLYTICLMAICTAFSCSDDDDDVTANGRLFRTMFRCDNNTGKGSDDPYNCTVVDLNDVHLYWYGVDGAAKVITSSGPSYQVCQVALRLGPMPTPQALS